MRTGRPKLPPEQKRTKHLTVPLSVEEEVEIRAAAKGKPSVWARETLLAVARLEPDALDALLNTARLRAKVQLFGELITLAELASLSGRSQHVVELMLNSGILPERVLDPHALSLYRNKNC